MSELPENDIKMFANFKIYNLTLIEKFLLLFKKSQYSQDISKAGVITIKYKVLNGKVYVLKEAWNATRQI